MPESIDFTLRFILFAISHSLLAAPKVQKRIKLISGCPESSYRLCYNLLSCLLFGWVMLAWQSTSVLYVVPGVWSLVMYAIQLLLLLAMVLCLKQTGLAAFLGFRTPKDSSPTLTTTGCYAVVRHPLYLLGLLFFVCNPVMTSRWLALSLFSLIYMLIGAKLEENRLLAEFGSSYSNYQSRVPFIIPRPRRETDIPASSQP